MLQKYNVNLSHKTFCSILVLFSLFLLAFKVRRARVIKINRGGFIDRQWKGVGVGEEENRRWRYFFFFLTLRARSRLLASLSRTPMFSKTTKRKINQLLCTGYIFIFLMFLTVL